MDRLRRLWARPLWQHSAALGAVLVAAVAIAGPGTAFTVDEGYALIQAEQLSTTGQWTVDYPLAEEGFDVPVVNATRGENGTAPYARHPLYPLTLGVLQQVGTAAVLALSITGTVVAAAMAALIARSFNRRYGAPALWLAGVASPLFFYSHVVVAHTIGAAAAGIATWCAMEALGTRRRHLWWTVGAACAVTVGALYRSEAVILALALGAAALLVGRRGIVLATAVTAAGLGTFVVERAWVDELIGRPGGPPIPAATSDFASGRISGLLATWIDPAYSSDSIWTVTALAGAALVIMAAVRLRQQRHTEALALAGLGTLLYGLRLVFSPADTIPGIVVAFPLGIAGLLLLSRGALADRRGRFLVATSVMVAIGVLATQYAEGGGLEWGWRYYAVALPIVVPLAINGLARARAVLSGGTLTVATAIAVALMVVPSGVAMRAISANHRNTARQAAAIGELAASAQNTPAVLTDFTSLPVLLHPEFLRYAWIVTELDDPHLASTLRAAGYDEVVVVSTDPSRFTGNRLMGEVAAPLPTQLVNLRRR